MKKELESLKESAKKVKADRVKEGIDKLYSLFALFLNNKNEQRAVKNKQEQQQPEQIDKAIGELRSEVSTVVKETEKKILEATNEAHTSSKEMSEKRHSLLVLAIGHAEQGKNTWIAEHLRRNIF